MYHYLKFLELPILYRNVLGNKYISQFVFKHLWLCEICNKFIDIQDTKNYICDDRKGQIFICNSCNSNILIVDRIHEMLPKYGEFLLSLIGPEFRIIGSLPLQCMLGERWEGSDVDIYTTLDVEKIKLPEGIKLIEVPKKVGYVKIPGVVKMWEVVGANIDIIQITDWDTIWTGIDFDFCKCYYDGTKCLAICPQSVKTKSCVTNYFRVRVDERIDKYRERGFKIEINE